MTNFLISLRKRQSQIGNFRSGLFLTIASLEACVLKYYLSDCYPILVEGKFK